MKITLQPQECEGTYKFAGTILYTKGIEKIFGEDVFLLVFETMGQIQKLVKEGIADYFQVFTVEYKNNLIKFYCIDDCSHITFLLPEEY